MKKYKVTTLHLEDRDGSPNEVEEEIECHHIKVKKNSIVFIGQVKPTSSYGDSEFPIIAIYPALFTSIKLLQ